MLQAYKDQKSSGRVLRRCRQQCVDRAAGAYRGEPPAMRCAVILCRTEMAPGRKAFGARLSVTVSAPKSIQLSSDWILPS